MFKLFLALHLLFAVFAIGPLVHAATTAGRAVRQGDAAAAASSARMLRIYSYASVLVVVLGFAVLGMKFHGQKVGDFSDLWVWLSLVLWAAGVAIVLALLVPALAKVGSLLGSGQSASSMTARVAAGGGIVGVIFAVIVFLMVYRPGS
ncbi:MAG TPA: hypothetical protein VGH30_12980 [Jatrophihabitantaceae bacterium]